MRLLTLPRLYFLNTAPTRDNTRVSSRCVMLPVAPFVMRLMTLLSFFSAALGFADRFFSSGGALETASEQSVTLQASDDRFAVTHSPAALAPRILAVIAACSLIAASISSGDTLTAHA